MGRYALLVATSSYFASGLRDLHTVEEAHELRTLLADRELGHYDTAHLVINGTKAEIERRVETLFQDRDDTDLVLLYIAGHGIKNDDNQLFFAATDTDVQLPYSTAVPAEVVHRIATESQAGSAAILLDCCYSGVFNHGSAHRAGEPVNVTELLGSGLFTMTATNAIEYAYERRITSDEGSRPGTWFTAAIIEAMRSGAPDLDGDGKLTFNELYKFVSDEVTKYGKQTPGRGGTQYGDMPFSRVRGAPSRQPARAPLRITELLAERADDAPPTMPVPIGRTDETNRGPGRIVDLDVFRTSEHVAVVGHIRSGKSTLLHTLIIGLTATFGADQLQFKCLDGGGALGALPQVSSAGHTPEAVAELLGQVAALIEERRDLFPTGIGTIEKYRRLRRERPDLLPDGDHSETFLIIDGWAWFADRVPGLADAVVRIADDGPKFGVHVLVTARRWSELPAELLDLIRGRIELPLADPAESRNPELSAQLPATGWALHEDRKFQVAQPWSDEAEGAITELSPAPVEAAGAPAEPDPPAPAPAPASPPALASVSDQVSASDQASASASASDQASVPTPALAPASAPAPTTALFPLLTGRDVTEFDPAVAWQPGPVAERYRATIGFGCDEDDGAVAVLDLKEAAHGGMGPHGLCLGAAGAGKSELLRTAVLSLLATHSPEELTVVLVEHAGGAAFGSFRDAPHVAALVPAAIEDPEQLDRLCEALAGEIQHRQTSLDKVRTRTVWEYRGLRVDQDSGVDQDLPPMPMLLVVIDGADELARRSPELLELLRTIGKVGRSLQVQLLLAARDPDADLIGGEPTYRVELHGSAGRPTGAPETADPPRSGDLHHPGGTVRFRPACASERKHGDRGPDSPTELEFAVRRMRGTGPSARRILTPPLREPPALEQLLPPPAARADEPRLLASIGMADLPFEHQQRPAQVDLSGGSGHVGIVGEAGSGKSVAVRTLLLSLALTHTPREVQFYCVDLGGGELHDLRKLPHVGAVSGRHEPDVLRGTIAELRTLLAWREARFIERGIDSMSGYRDRRRRGENPDDDRYGDVFLIIDGWTALQREFDGVDRDVVDLASQGREFGLHVVVTAHRWPEIRPALKKLLGTRLELRLADPAESEISPEAAARVPQDLPGRGLHPAKRHMFTALPHPVGDGSAAAVAALRARLRDTWPGMRAPRVRLLPTMLPYDRLPAPEEQPRPSMVPIGVNEHGMDPVYLDFRADPHFYAFGEPQSGRTSLLRTVLRGITTRYSPQEAAVVLVDLRRSLLGFLRTEHSKEHAVNLDQVRAVVRELVVTLRTRRPGPDLPREQLRNRSWWTGPELFVVVDDYELLCAAGENPLAPLAEFVAQSAELGLHLVLTRAAAGAGEDQDPLLTALRAGGAPGLLLSADEREGELIGTAAVTSLPPGRGTLVSRASRGGRQFVQTAHIRAD